MCGDKSRGAESLYARFALSRKIVKSVSYIKEGCMKKISMFLIFVFVFLTFSGCGGTSIYANYREVETLDLIHAVGVDKSGGEISVTACSGKGKDDIEPTLFKNTAKSLARALDELYKSSSKEDVLFYHTEHFVVGEEAAREGINKYLDYAAMAKNLRLRTNLFIVKGNTAKELITKTTKAKGSASDMLQTIKKDVDMLSEGYVYTCGEVFAALEKTGCAITLAVELVPLDECEKNGELRIAPAGYAVIKEGRVVGYADTQLARGIGILTGKMKYDIAEIPDGMGGLAVIQLTKAKIRVTPQYKEGSIISVDIEVTFDGTIEELQNPLNLEDGKTIERLSKEVALVERKRIQDALNLAQSLGADFMDLGGLVEMRTPVEFAKLITSWKDAFPEIQFNVKVDTAVNRIYNFSGPANVA